MSKIFEAVRRAEMAAASARGTLAPAKPLSWDEPSEAAGAVGVGVLVAPSEPVERRNQKRSKLGVPVRVRPSDPEQAEQFDEVLKTQNTSKGGLYLSAAGQFYCEGMRLFVTLPYSTVTSFPNSEYWGEVVRVDRLPHGRVGVAVRMLGSMNLMPL